MSAPAVNPSTRTLSPAQTSMLGRATIGDQLRRLARSQGSTPAIVAYDAQGGRTSTSYAELNTMANRVAHVLLDLGVGRGDRVAVMSRNRVETVATYYGALKVGAAYSGVSSMFREGEVAQQLRHLEPAVLVVEQPLSALAGPIADSLGISVLVVGDARSNGFDPRVDLFAELARRVHRVAWLTPEPRRYWTQTGCALDEYSLHCSGAVSARDGTELIEKVDELGSALA